MSVGGGVCLSVVVGVMDLYFSLISVLLDTDMFLSVGFSSGEF